MRIKRLRWTEKSKDRQTRQPIPSHDETYPIHNPTKFHLEPKTKAVIEIDVAVTISHASGHLGIATTVRVLTTMTIPLEKPIVIVF